MLKDQNVNKTPEMFRKRIENKTQNIIMLLSAHTLNNACNFFNLTS